MGLDQPKAEHGRLLGKFGQGIAVNDKLPQGKSYLPQPATDDGHDFGLARGNDGPGAFNLENRRRLRPSPCRSGRRYQSLDGGLATSPTVFGTCGRQGRLIALFAIFNVATCSFD